MIEVISATRQDPSGFRTTPLGISLDRLSFDSRLSPQVAFENARGLPEVYNQRIQATSGSDVSWYFKNEDGQRDEERYLSGAVAHGPTPCGPVTYYGAYPAECELLDGVLLAATRSTLARVRVEFDQAFDFHFYDLDFSRSARKAGLCVGTWPIAITHTSGGSFGTVPWRKSLNVYREKWD